MRLHTDFHDYYDNAVGYGIDENVHYNRFAKKVEIQFKPKFDFDYSGKGLLGFCGKIYPFRLIQKYNRNRKQGEEFKIIERFFAFSFEEYKTKESEWEDCSYDFGYFYSKQETKLKQFFINFSEQNDEIFLKYKVPIWTFMIGRSKETGLINPKLKDYGFDRIKDSFTAFQDISMYLSNILVEQKEVAVIEDKYRIEQHGFDLKTSFRKEKKF